jgi:hypothetical protein
MASQGGLTRRRGAGGAAAAADGDDESSSRVTSPGPRTANSYNDRSPETAYESGENGHKIAYDPRDISENAERSKQPKLTLMEEILLLGLKDKQVGLATQPVARETDLIRRAISHSGMTIYHMLSEAASSLSSPSVAE